MPLLDLIVRIETEKRGKRHPHHATESELCKLYPGATAELEQLEQHGIITMGETINSRYIHVKGRNYN